MIAPRYMLDTNVIIDAAHGRVPDAVERMRAYAIGELVMSMVTLAELEHSWQAGKGDREKVGAFLSMVPALAFDEAAAVGFGYVMANSPRPPRGSIDRLIAGHARGLGVPVVTSNLSEFERFVGVEVEDWSGD